MILTVELPDRIASQLHLDGSEAQRQALVGIVVEGYRRHDLSRGQVSELLDLSFGETADLLKEHGCAIGSDMTIEDYKRDYEAAKAYLKR